MIRTSEKEKGGGSTTPLQKPLLMKLHKEEMFCAGMEEGGVLEKNQGERTVGGGWSEILWTSDANKERK